MNYFEFNERKTQQSVPLDVVEWPDFTLSEGEMDEDTALELDLMRERA